jgi:hypothetical protein
MDWQDWMMKCKMLGRGTLGKDIYAVYNVTQRKGNILLL